MPVKLHGLHRPPPAATPSWLAPPAPPRPRTRARLMYFLLSAALLGAGAAWLQGWARFVKAAGVVDGNAGHLHVRAFVPEGDARSLEAGGFAEVRLLSGERLRARVDKLEPAAPFLLAEVTVLDAAPATALTAAAPCEVRVKRSWSWLRDLGD